MSYVGRLAPSPTGLLHLGHARTFWTAYERTQAARGRLWLREEDLDTQRVREEFSLAMKQDLRWLGITWDGEACQSKRLPLYRAALETLLARGVVYRCTCSRRDLALAMSAPHEDGVLHDPEDEPVYSGKCRPETNLSTTFVDDANYRFRVTDGEAVAFDDIHAGAQTFVAGKDFGDFLVWRKDGLPSYQLACVVDDAEMRITEVVRGGDLLKSTARQMLLQRALDLATPQYFHCDLMRDAGGIRLAKRHDALSLRALREQGMRPEELRAQFLRLNR